MASRRRIITTSVGVGALAALTATGCSAVAGASPDAQWAAPGSGGGSPSPSAPPADITVSPAAGAKDVAPSEPVVVTATGGTLQTVTVTAGGVALTGALDTDGHTWRSTGALGYGQTYTVTATIAGTGSGATPVSKTSTFTTVKPADTVRVTFQANALTVLRDGGTYGVGQPVIVAFNKSIGDKQAAEKAIQISTSPSVVGKFFWLDDKTVHWRPQKYWAKGTTVTVAVNVLGVHLGKGVYGARNASASFTIGRSLVAVADNNTHYTKVYIDGALVRTMACSLGKGGTTKGSDGKTIDFWTRTGPHVVLEKDQQVTMDSASYGIKDKSNPNYYSEVVTLCTRISYSGEYLHAAPWNMSDHGRRNTSHGCINLSTKDAQWVFDTFLLGDIVEVTGTPKPLPAWDGLGDWNVPWDQY